MYSAKIICDSVSETGKRITTFELCLPRIVLSEFNTHRMLSRNSASSRAIPVEKMIERVLIHPFVPEKFPANFKGMQPNTYWEKGDYKYKLAETEWLNARDNAVNSVRKLTADSDNGIKVHKQIANRLLEPFLWHIIICTATEFDNFFKLRTNEQAQYEIRRIADLMYDAYHAFDNPKNQWGDEPISRKLVVPNDVPFWEAVKPRELKIGEWHLPFISDDDNTPIQKLIVKEYGAYSFGDGKMGQRYNELRKQISVARCARVSYLTHDGKRDIEKDLELFERLRTSGHYSPFEHVATPSFVEAFNSKERYILCQHDEQVGNFFNIRNGNFIGWRQMRQDLPNENCTYFRKGEER